MMDKEQIEQFLDGLGIPRVIESSLKPVHCETEEERDELRKALGSLCYEGNFEEGFRLVPIARGRFFTLEEE